MKPTPPQPVATSSPRHASHPPRYAGPAPTRTALIAALVVWSYPSATVAVVPESRPAADVLTPRQWQRLDGSVDLGLTWLATQQQSDGSFRTTDKAQPGITSLAVLAFLARGHLPGQGPYGERLERAVSYVATCQKKDGLLSRIPPKRRMTAGMPSHTAAYCHAISGLMLSEVFGTTDSSHADKIRGTIEQAISHSLYLQKNPRKQNTVDVGGWRYVRRWPGSSSDLSITSWHLMFLRSARNAGFDVPSEPIDTAMDYVQRCCRPDGSVWYGLIGQDRHTTPAMVGAGALSLSLGGMHGTDKATRAGDWLLAHPLAGDYGSRRFHYNAFYTAQGMHQLGGRYWSSFYPPLIQTLIDHQRPDGSWPPEPTEEHWGSCLSTSLAVLTLAIPYDLLPIFQR